MKKALDFCRPHLLRDPREYESALAEIGRLMEADNARNASESERLGFLALLVEDYEDRHFPISGKLRPQDAVDFMLEQRGLARSDLIKVMGGRSRVSEFFAATRQLSKSQIAALRDFLRIPADVLLG